MTDFDAELRVIEDDLASERTSLAKELRKFAGRNQAKKSDDALRTERWCREYLAEIRPGPHTPDQPCVCGDRVFWRPSFRKPWQCRSCSPPRSEVQVRWFVVGGHNHPEAGARRRRNPLALGAA
jgi:hypothetical protein